MEAPRTDKPLQDEKPPRPKPLHPRLSTVSAPCFAFIRKKSLCDDDSIYLNSKEVNYFHLCGCYISIPVFFMSLMSIITLCCSNLYDNEILKIITLKDGHIAYDTFKTPTVLNNVYVYGFNYTNSEEAMRGREKLRVEEIGPYVYKEHIVRVNIVNNFNGTLTFQERRSYTFLPELSAGSPYDKIVAPSLLLMTLAAKNMPGFFLRLGGLRPFMEMKVDEFIWGWRYPTSWGYLPSVQKIGILAKRAGMNEPITLGSEVENIGIISNVEGKDRIGLWEDDYCDSLEASTGTFWPGIHLKRSSTLFLYVKDFCRRLPLKYQNDVMVAGLPAYRFTYPKDVFYSGPDNPDNVCFCNKSCPPAGAFLTSQCTEGAPVAVSFPHFLHGNEELFSRIDGLSPDPRKHASFMDIHAKLGIALAGSNRFQINSVMKNARTTGFGSIPDETVLPVAWMDFRIGNLTDHLTEVLMDVTYTSAKVKTGLICGSFILLVLSFSVLFYLGMKRWSSK